MVIEITKENFYLCIIVLWGVIQIVQWRKIHRLESVLEYAIENIQILSMAADQKFNNLEKKIDDGKQTNK
jgi:hypothetical protein